MEALTALFGSEARIKILRLFLFNPDGSFSAAEIARRTQVSGVSAKRELRELGISGIVKARTTGKGATYHLNVSFPHLEPLKSLLIISSVSADTALLKRFAGVGRLKLLIASGVFIRNWDSRVDLLIVGDNLSLRKIETAIRGIEAEIGKEITYSSFETADFEYRLGIHDRLVRDILDEPHTTLLDRLGVEPS